MFLVRRDAAPPKAPRAARSFPNRSHRRGGAVRHREAALHAGCNARDKRRAGRGRYAIDAIVIRITRAMNAALCKNSSTAQELAWTARRSGLSDAPGASLDPRAAIGLGFRLYHAAMTGSSPGCQPSALPHPSERRTRRRFRSSLHRVTGATGQRPATREPEELMRGKNRPLPGPRATRSHSPPLAPMMGAGGIGRPAARTPVKDLSFPRLKPVRELFPGTDRLLLHHCHAGGAPGHRVKRSDPETGQA